MCGHFYCVMIPEVKNKDLQLFDLYSRGWNSRRRKRSRAFEISARLQAALARVDHKESMDKQDFTAPETLSLPPKKRLPLNVRAGINLDFENLSSKRTDYNEIYTDPKHFSLLKWLENNEKHRKRTTKRRKSLRKKKTSVPADKVESSTAPHRKESCLTKGATMNGSSVYKDSDDESDFIGFPDDGGHLCLNQSLRFHDSDNDSNVSGFIGFSDDGSDPDGFPGFPDDGWNFCSLKVIVTDELGFYGFSNEDYVMSVKELECMNRTVALERMYNYTESEFSYPESDCPVPTNVSEIGVDNSVAEKDPVAFEYDDITMSEVLSSHSEEY